MVGILGVCPPHLSHRVCNDAKDVELCPAGETKRPVDAPVFILKNQVLTPFTCNLDFFRWRELLSGHFCSFLPAEITFCMLGSASENQCTLVPPINPTSVEACPTWWFLITGQSLLFPCFMPARKLPPQVRQLPRRQMFDRDCLIGIEEVASVQWHHGQPS